jgi:hypothetical protein
MVRHDRVDERCTSHHGWGVLSFLHSHLVHPSLSIVLSGLGRGRVSIAVWWCSCSLSWGGWLTSIGTTISIMTILFIVEASCVYFSRRCILSGWSPFNNLIPSIWSLKDVEAWNFKCFKTFLMI